MSSGKTMGNIFRQWRKDQSPSVDKVTGKVTKAKKSFVKLSGTARKLLRKNLKEMVRREKIKSRRIK